MALAAGPSASRLESAGEPDGRRVSHAGWETPKTCRAVVAILRHDGGPLRARDILTILRETGTSFITENPVYSVVGALKVARENGWVVKKGRGWWQAASQGRVVACEGVDDGESTGGSEGSSGGTHAPYA